MGSLLMRRRLLWVSAAMILGIIAENAGAFIAVIIILAGFACVCVLYLKPEYDVTGIRTILLACTVAMLSGSIRMALQQSVYGSLSGRIDSDEAMLVRAEVIRADHKKESVPKLTVRIIDTQDRYKRLDDMDCLLSCYENTSGDLWQLTGSVIEFRGRLDVPEGARNPRCFDYRTYLRGRGIGLICSTNNIRVIKENGSVLGAVRRRVISFREGFIGALCNETNDKTEALLRGVLFGDTNSMDEEMKDDFRSNGTAHVLAVSGLHIGLLYSIFRTLRRRTPIAGMTGVFIAILAVYGTMTLWTASVTRAAAVIFLMETGERLDRRFDLLTSLGFVSMLVLISNPYALYDTSFIMSYLAALSIGVLYPVIKRHLPDWLPDSIKTSLAVQAGLVPYIAYTFNTVALGAVIINIPVVLLLSVIVTLSASSMPLYLISQCLGYDVMLVPFSRILEYAAGSMIILNERFSDIDLLSPDVVSPPLFIVAAYYGMTALFCSESFMIARRRKDMKMIIPQITAEAVVIFLSFLMSISPFDRADIVMADVGQGDCVHLRSGGINVIIDGGGNENYNVGKKTLKPYFLKNGIRKVDLALATHLHTDHYKGIEELAEEGMVRRIIKEGKKGDVISFNNSRIDIIWPDIRDPNTDDENKNSLIFKVHINGITMLITGDIGEEGEHALVERYRGTDVLDCDVLKVCHHGSRYSSTKEFLEAVSPEVALIGVGKNNTYGHPSDEAIERLKACGAVVLRTDIDGAVGIRRTRKGLSVCKMGDRIK
ncbi:MAG: DNA internalization-related competence protein ComEC/Rec2 [Eubacterium sp.]|nr:DNA internalization-related competence protein ComEC/Rec2 [Eubacterium sp.]